MFGRKFYQKPKEKVHDSSGYIHPELRDHFQPHPGRHIEILTAKWIGQKCKLGKSPATIYQNEGMALIIADNWSERRIFDWDTVDKTMTTSKRFPLD